MHSRLSLIVAMDKNRLIGGQNKLLWHIPGELKRFKEITTGHPIIMGRKTFASIGRVLPNRTNIVISRNPKFSRAPLENLVMAKSLAEAIEIAQTSPGNHEIFII